MVGVYKEFGYNCKCRKIHDTETTALLLGIEDSYAYILSLGLHLDVEYMGFVWDLFLRVECRGVSAFLQGMTFSWSLF